jgi:hypothetical protein
MKLFIAVALAAQSALQGGGVLPPSWEKLVFLDNGSSRAYKLPNGSSRATVDVNAMDIRGNLATITGSITAAGTTIFYSELYDGRNVSSFVRVFGSCQVPLDDTHLVSFPEKGALGLKITASQSGAQIAFCHPQGQCHHFKSVRTIGTKKDPDLNVQVKPGMVVAEVNGENVRDYPFKQVQRRLSNKNRPMNVRFSLGPLQGQRRFLVRYPLRCLRESQLKSHIHLMALVPSTCIGFHR